jgi:uncharacterized protein YjeT (DUF2065 family)
VSFFSIFLVVFGLLIVVTRAPLIFAPRATRDLIMKLLETDARTRALGLFMAVFGGTGVWAAYDVPGILAAVISFICLFAANVGVFAMIRRPAWSRQLAEQVWNKFSEPALRVIGGIAVLFGLGLAYYGFTL